MNIKDKIVVALDVDSMEEAKSLVDELFEYTGTFKVGLQMFCRYGLEIINYILSKNSNFFLDVKLHDIPNTVQKASESIVLNGANFFNVHTQGGLLMMQKAREGADLAAKMMNKKPPLILGVTVLTSISDEILKNDFEINKSAATYAIELAKLAYKAGLDGVVASAFEAKRIKEETSSNFKVLCPGIRPLWSLKDDQQRVATPSFAINNGADFIVLGRAVTKAKFPKEAMIKIYDEIKEGEKCLQH